MSEFFFYLSSLEKMESTSSWNQATTAKLDKGLHLVTRSIHRRCSIKKVLLIISCNVINKKLFYRTPPDDCFWVMPSRIQTQWFVKYQKPPQQLRKCSDANAEGELKFRLPRIVEENYVKAIKKRRSQQFGNDLHVCLLCLCRSFGNVLNMDNKKTTLSVMLQFAFSISEFPVSVRYISENLSD